MNRQFQLDELIPLSTAASLFPKGRQGKRIHVSCVFRYAKHGKRGIRLESWLAGPRLCTTPAAIERFILRLSEKANLPPPPQTDAVNDAAAAGERLKQFVFRRHSRQQSGGAE